MALGNVMRGRREIGRSFRGRGMVRGHGRGMHRAPGLGTFRGPGVAPPSRRPLGVDTRPSSLKIAKSFKRTNDMAWRHDLFEDSVVAASGHSGAEDGGAKLYISNLDFRVSNNDIKELFSELGELKRYGVHYDNHGRPNGSAEVVFVRRSDAVAAFKKYNNVQLDGKPMKIELIGIHVGLPVMPRFNVVATAHGRGKRTVVMMPETNQRGAGPSNRVASGGRRGRGGSQHGHMNGSGLGRGRGGGRGRGRSMGGRSGGSRGRGGRGFWRRADKSAAQLDKELDNYHAQAMNTS